MSAPAAVEPVRNPVSLRQRVFRAGGWSFAGFALSQIIRFGSSLVMTRLLAPEIYGVMSIATMILVGLALFSDLGLRASVIQNKRGHEPVFLNTVWVMQIAVGCLIAAASIFVAGGLALATVHGLIPTSSAYADPVLPYVVGVLGLSTIVGSLESTKVAEARRRLAFGRLTSIGLGGQVVSVALMIVIASVMPSVWAVVIGTVIGNVVSVVLSHFALPGVKNRLKWDRASAREVVSFGKWIVLSSAFNFFGSSADKLLLGAFFTTTTLGVYSIASMLAFAVVDVLGKVVGEVAFPALSEVARERRHDLKATVYKVYVPLAGLSYAAAAALAMSGGTVIRLLYDPRYWDAGWMLQILAGVVVSIPSRIHSQCFLALGHSRWHSQMAIMRALFVVLAIPGLYYAFGLVGAVVGAMLSHVSVIPLVYFYAARAGVFDARREMLSVLGVAPGLAAGALVNYIF